MATSAEIASLRNYSVASESYVSQRVEDDFIANPRMITNLQFPGIRNRRRRSNHNALPDRSSEASQEEYAPTIEGLRRSTKEERLDYPPKLDKPRRTAPKSGRHHKKG
jgi:hypothetical protein